MRLTPAAELAIRGVLVLAEKFGEGPIALARVCEIRDLPKEYLTKLFAALSRQGIITPIRGKKGGYMLAREPGEINLLEVIEAVEGPIALNWCMQDPPKCDLSESCKVHPVWAELQRTIRNKLQSMTLADVVETNGSISC